MKFKNFQKILILFIITVIVFFLLNTSYKKPKISSVKINISLNDNFYNEFLPDQAPNILPKVINIEYYQLLEGGLIIKLISTRFEENKRQVFMKSDDLCKFYQINNRPSWSIEFSDKKKDLSFIFLTQAKKNKKCINNIVKILSEHILKEIQFFNKIKLLSLSLKILDIDQVSFTKYLNITVDTKEEDRANLSIVYALLILIIGMIIIFLKPTKSALKLIKKYV